jgi:hypothetical protein
MMPGDVRTLQRTYGNRAVTQLLAVSQLSAPTPSFQPIQHQEKAKDHDRNAELQIQRRADRGTDAAPDLEASIQQARANGQPLAESIRMPMEQAFGRGLDDVMIHADDRSDHLSRAVEARAFTTGHDIFFRRGEYNPGSRVGQELIAHELTHVVQQTGKSQTRSGAQTAPVARDVIQRKTQNIHIDKRLRRRDYGKRVNGDLDSLVARIRAYNTIPLNDLNYQDHLQKLDAIEQKAWAIEKFMDAPYMLGRGLKKLGGPFRYRYYMLIRNLRKLAGYALGASAYKGTVTVEIANVKKQSARGIQVLT